MKSFRWLRIQPPQPNPLQIKNTDNLMCVSVWFVLWLLSSTLLQRKNTTLRKMKEYCCVQTIKNKLNKLIETGIKRVYRVKKIIWAWNDMWFSSYSTWKLWSVLSDWTLWSLKASVHGDIYSEECAVFFHLVLPSIASTDVTCYWGFISRNHICRGNVDCRINHICWTTDP